MLQISECGIIEYYIMSVCPPDQHRDRSPFSHSAILMRTPLVHERTAASDLARVYTIRDQ